jgi:hypothetical protein
MLRKTTKKYEVEVMLVGMKIGDGVHQGRDGGDRYRSANKILRRARRRFRRVSYFDTENC